ncbi:large ribosomal subunit protein uL13m [Planococcus citri]|uniref:large ribosomal subunit protein uL13m n=1 Tax=Planococcus citri TaxID=170843 RepID=UPI0031F7FFA5
MSSWERVKQWNALTRVWHIFDARWQNPLLTAPLICKYLKGTYKPTYHPMGNCGDHVVVINSRQVALPGEEWRWRVYFHDTGYAKGKTYTRAWELHDRDPTMIFKKSVYANLGHNLQRRYTMERLHVFPDENVPTEILENVTNQIRPIRIIPRTLDTYTEEEIKSFPKVYNYPEDYIVR